MEADYGFIEGWSGIPGDIKSMTTVRWYPGWPFADRREERDRQSTEKEEE